MVIHEVTIPVSVFTSLIRQSERLQGIERHMIEAKKRETHFIDLDVLDIIGGFGLNDCNTEEAKDGV